MEKSKSSGSIALRVIIAVLVAVAIWLYVDIGEAKAVHTTVRNIPVEFSGENGVLADRNLMLLSGYDTTIDLWLEGPRSTLWKLDQSKIRIVVDTSSITETGMQSLSYDVVFPDNISRSSIKVEKASAYSVTVTVGELATKEIPVYCDISGQVADGYFTEPVLLDPATLVLRGQRDDLLDVSYALVTLDADGTEKSITKNLAYTLYDYNDIALEVGNIRTATTTVLATLTVKTTKEVPLVINFEEAPGSTMATMHCDILPQFVQLTGEKDALENVDSIILDTIYLQDLESYASYEYRLTAPEGTTLPEGVNKATATIVVSNVIERVITVSDFVFNDVPEGYTAKAVTESLDILVRGITDEINALEDKDIVLTASLANFSTEGNYTVAVRVDIPGFANVGAKGRYQVIVNISLTPEEPETPEGEEGENGENNGEGGQESGSTEQP